VWNATFDAAAVIYDTDYEGTQIHSAVFRDYLADLAVAWLSTCDERVESILEVGCGQGEFLEALAAVTSADLTGYDPAWRGSGGDRAEIVAAVLPDAPAQRAGVVLNRMTLEHIADPLPFVRRMAEWLAPGGTLITQVPDAARMIEKQLVGDLVHEHVNYFTGASLTALLRRAGFVEMRVSREYADQHLTVFARRVGTPGADERPLDQYDLDRFARSVNDFGPSWDARMREFVAQGCRVVVWGAGSRATALLASLPEPGLVSFAVDINPRREGTYILGTECPTHLPEVLRDEQQLAVVVTNSIYEGEIRAELNRLEVSAELVMLDATGPAA
jgi:SAM-dependent methyltransferase